MKTEIIRTPDDKALVRAAEVIKNGGIVAFPTETVYGLGVSALDEHAAEKVYTAKGRPSDNPLIVHLAFAEDAVKFAYVNETFEKLAQLFMPGPITVILPKKQCIPSSVTGGLDTVGIRVPSDFIAHRLIEFAGVPIAAPSANISGKPSCTTAEHVIHDMDGKIDMILDGGESRFGLESTIVAAGEDCLKLLRPGAVTVEMLEGAGFRVVLDKAVTEKLDENEKPLAPGMKYRHYAPKAQVVLLDGESELVDKFLSEQKNKKNVAVLCCEEDRTYVGAGGVFVGSINHPEQQAHMLFAALRELDEKNDVSTIYAKLPKTNDIGLAIFNRMLKASGYTVKKLK